MSVDKRSIKFTLFNYIYTLLYSGDYNDNAESETIVLVLVLQW